GPTHAWIRCANSSEVSVFPDPGRPAISMRNQFRSRVAFTKLPTDRFSSGAKSGPRCHHGSRSLFRLLFAINLCGRHVTPRLVIAAAEGGACPFAVRANEGIDGLGGGVRRGQVLLAHMTVSAVTLHDRFLLVMRRHRSESGRACGRPARPRPAPSA